MFSISGVLCVFKVQQYRIRREIKHQIKAGIPEEELHEFTLSKREYEQLDWQRTDIEFRKGARMFDIVHAEQVGDSIRLRCVNDEEEQKLFAQLDLLIKRKMEQESQAPDSPLSKVIKVLKLVYLNNEADNTFPTESMYHAPYSRNKENLYISPFPEHLTPPPDTV